MIRDDVIRMAREAGGEHEITAYDEWVNFGMAELERFVYDQTGIVLNLKGRSNKFKYQTAMDVLNGKTPDSALLGSENPYLDKNDIVPAHIERVIPFHK